MRYNRLSCGGLVIGAIAIVVIIVLLVVNSCAASKAAAPFKDMEGQAQTVCAKCTSVEPLSTSPYRIGKVLVVHTAGDTVGHTMADKTLAGILAISPGEVGTVICVGAKTTKRINSSFSSYAAYQLSREICVIDWITGDVIYKTTLKGSAPATSRSKPGSSTGTDPENTRLRDFIANLPEK
ncbi:MAG: hypothetical protein ACYCZF_10820 [Anaerolineae bacterium]